MILSVREGILYFGNYLPYPFLSGKEGIIFLKLVAVSFFHQPVSYPISSSLSSFIIEMLNFNVDHNYCIIIVWGFILLCHIHEGLELLQCLGVFLSILRNRTYMYDNKSPITPMNVV